MSQKEKKTPGKVATMHPVKDKKTAKKKKEEGTEPLSNFQEAKTGRTDIDQLEQQQEEQKRKQIKFSEIDVSMEIQKLKLVDDLFLTVEYIESHNQDEVRNKVAKECAWPVHEDLKKAFSAFNVHLALLCGYFDDKKIKGEPEDFTSPSLNLFSVQQVSLSNKGDGITITGRRKVYNKTLNLNTPFTKFYEDTAQSYKFSTNLEILWDDLISEASQYLDGSKHGEGKQLEMDLSISGEKPDEETASQIVEEAL